MYEDNKRMAERIRFLAHSISAYSIHGLCLSHMICQLWAWAIVSDSGVAHHYPLQLWQLLYQTGALDPPDEQYFLSIAVVIGKSLKAI